MTNELEFLQIIAEELEVDSEELNLETEFRSIPNWSSLNALLVVSRINDETDVLISTSDLANCKTLKDIFQRVKDSK